MNSQITISQEQNKRVSSKEDKNSIVELQKSTN